jgi:hypothetical protein
MKRGFKRVCIREALSHPGHDHSTALAYAHDNIECIYIKLFTVIRIHLQFNFDRREMAVARRTRNPVGINTVSHR